MNEFLEYVVSSTVERLSARCSAPRRRATVDSNICIFFSPRMGQHTTLSKLGTVCVKNKTGLPTGVLLLFFFFLFFILRRMGKNKALAHHTSTYFHTRRVSI